MKRFLLMFFAFVSFAANSQSVNNYNVAVVKSKYDFQKSPDQYSLNTYTKMFMEKYGFTAFLDTDQMPSELASGNCDKLFIDLVDNSNMLVTKLTVIMKDCSNKVLFTSIEGTSRQKDYKAAYLEALRMAFRSFDAVNYKFTGESSQKQPAKKSAESVSVSVDTQPNSKVTLEKSSLGLKAVSSPTGFVVFDDGRQVMELFRTSSPDVFIAKSDSVSGVVQKSEGKWVFEFYSLKNLVSQTLEIEFQ